MHDLSPDLLARLADYFAQELSPGEALAVEQWLAEHPDFQTIVRRLEQSRFDLRGRGRAGYVSVRDGVSAQDNISAQDDVSILDDVSVHDDVTAISVALARHIDSERASESERAGERTLSAERTLPAPQPLARSKDRTSRWIRLRQPSANAIWHAMIGAMVCILAFVGWQVGLRHVHSHLPVPMSTYATGKGELATITLPDGSTIVLNVASRLQVPTNYAAGNRTVYLAGEALFTVSHRRGAPFTVIAGPSTTRVLGTSFLVRHYATDTAATVAVRDGKVAVQSTVLAGAQQVSVGSRGIGLIRPATAMQFSFASGMLMIDDMTLPAAIPELNRWYNADIRLGDSTLTTRKVFGSFKSGSLTDLSAILDMMFNVRVVRDGHTLTLYPRQ